MVISSKERDQGEKDRGEKRDPALSVKSADHVSELKPWIQAVRVELQGHPWNHGTGRVAPEGLKELPLGSVSSCSPRGRTPPV